MAPLYRRDIIRELAIASGSRKLIAGQVADLEAEGHHINRKQLALHPREQDRRAHRQLDPSGAMAANASAKQLERQ